MPRVVARTVATTPMRMLFPNAWQTPWAEQTLSQLSNVKPRQTMFVRRESLNENTIV